MVAQKITKDLEKRFLVYEWLYNTVKSVASSLLHNDLFLSLKPINGVSGHVTTTPKNDHKYNVYCIPTL